MRIIGCVFVLAVVLPVASFSRSQQQAVERNVRDVANVDSEYLHEDTRQLLELSRKFPHTRLLGRNRHQGAAQLLLEHEGQPLLMITHKDGAMEVRRTRVFDGNDIETIADHHPELLKHVMDCPKTDEDGAEIQLTFRTTVTWQLDDKYQFELRHPELYEIYEAFREAPLPRDERFASATHAPPGR